MFLVCSLLLTMSDNPYRPLGPDDFHFRVDLWDDKDRSIKKVIAFVSDLEVARAAYEAAVKAKPGKRITLRQRARIIEKSFS
jgi:hypothetical protein